MCDRADECVTLPVWKGLYKVISEYVDSITLQDIVDKNADISSFDYVKEEILSSSNVSILKISKFGQ